MILYGLGPCAMPEIINPCSVTDLYYVVRPAHGLCFQL